MAGPPDVVEGEETGGEEDEEESRPGQPMGGNQKTQMGRGQWR